MAFEDVDFKEVISKISPFFGAHEDLEFFTTWMEALNSCCEYLSLEGFTLINTKTLQNFYYGKLTGWLAISIPESVSTIIKDDIEYGLIPVELPIFELSRLYITTDIEIPALGEDNLPNFFVHSYDDKSSTIALRKSVIDNYGLYGKTILSYRARLHDYLVYKALGCLVGETPDKDSFEYYKKVLGKYTFQLKQKNKTNLKDAVGFIANLPYTFGDDFLTRFQCIDEKLKIKTSLEDNLLRYLTDEDFDNVNQTFRSHKIKIISENEIYIRDDQFFDYGDIIKIYNDKDCLCIGKILKRYRKVIDFSGKLAEESIYRFRIVFKFDNIWKANNIKIIRMFNNKNIVMIYYENGMMNINEYEYLKRIEPVYIYLIIRNLFPLYDILKESDSYYVYIPFNRRDLTNYSHMFEFELISADSMIDSDKLTVL